MEAIGASVPSTSNIYQFHVNLRGATNPIWRRIQVPEDYTFFQLHRAVQSVMAWKDYHMHQFQIIDPRSHAKVLIGMKLDACFEERDVIDGKEARISDYFTIANKKATYTYDFGDDWDHGIRLERIVPSDGGDYPRCIDGQRAAPPEDCGGVEGYDDLLIVLSDLNDNEHQEMMEWIDHMKWKFEPEHFDPSAVVFE